MKLKSFRVRKFRNIVDSGDIQVDDLVTCLVGKNEAGKSGILEALYLFNPAYGESFSTDEHYPRWLVVQDRKAGNLAETTPISVELALESEDIAEIESALGQGVISEPTFRVEKKYNGERTWSLARDENQAVKNVVTAFPASLHSALNDIDSLASLAAKLESLREVDASSIDGNDIDAAFEVLNSQGLENTSVWSIINGILEPRLPTFFRFTSYSTLPGRIDFKEITAASDEGPAESGIQTAKALLELAGTDLSQLSNDDYELRKGELEAVQIDLTNQVFEYWKQNPYLEVLIDVDKETVQNANNTTAVGRFLDIRLRDRRTGYSNNFSQRSSGFQWFFSFLAAFSEFEGREGTVVLLDEPALTLHGKAQGDFLKFINLRLSVNSPVIYTTHSPFMVEADKLERVRVVEDNGPPAGAVVSDSALSADPDSLFPLQAALGYDIAQSLFVGPNNLVVEGTSDYIYLMVLSSFCERAQRGTLDPRWRILPSGGATNIPTFVSLIGPHLDITVVADSDTRGMQRVTNMTSKGLLKSSRLILVSSATDSDHADIEDLFSEGDYLKIYNKTFGRSLKVVDLPAGNRVVKRIEALTGEAFDHGKVAETLLKGQLEITLTETTLERFECLFGTINETMGS